MSDSTGPGRPRPVNDPAGRHRGVRRGRERGCWVYVPAEQMRAAGVNVERGQPPPDYRVWAGRKRTTLIQFYDRES